VLVLVDESINQLGIAPLQSCRYRSQVVIYRHF
jgi:hypothetical protein